MTVSGRWVTLKSARGHSFQVWRQYQPMPYIEQCFLDCGIYLYASRQSAEDGENFGGSGCLVAVLSDPVTKDIDWSKFPKRKRTSAYPPHIYAVTNKHVARRGYPVIRLNTVDGDIDVLELDHNDWIPHPDGDDLVIAPVELPAGKHHYFPIDLDLLVRREDVYADKTAHNPRVGAGDDTFMVGRFISHAGKQRNTPSLRFGNIAMLPFEKVKLGEAADRFMQEAFLVETRSVSGFSGSPVFVYEADSTESYVPGDGSYPGTYIEHLLVGQPRLLGIDCGHVPKYEKVVNGAGIPHPQGWKVGANSGMAIVIPAWLLDSLLNIERLVMQREAKDKRYREEKESEETVVMDTEEPPFTQESYQDALKRASSRVSEPEPKKTQTSE